MRQTLAAMLIAAVAIGGGLAGSLTARFPTDEARAGVESALYVNPGGSGHGVYLECGWHQTCGGAGGNALDWGNYAYEDVFWRSWGYYPSTLSTAIAKVTVGQRNADYNCKTSVADLNQVGSGASIGRIEYTHVDFLASEGQWFYAYGKSSYANTTWGPIAEATGYGEEQCSAFKDPHLHQRSGDAGSWTDNFSRYPYGNSETGPYDISYLEQWQSYTAW